MSAVMCLDDITEYKPNYTPRDFKNRYSSRNGAPRVFDVGGHKDLLDCVSSKKRECIPRKECTVEGLYLAHGRYSTETNSFIFDNEHNFIHSNNYIYVCDRVKSLSFKTGSSIVVEYWKADQDFIERNKDRIVFCFSKSDVIALKTKVEDGTFLVSEDMLKW